jgi:hypothetical protein
MGMFDYYEPIPAITCPTCGEPLSGWQGKEGPCALLIWRQGQTLPIENPGNEVGPGRARLLETWRLPRTFTLYTFCGCEQWVTARGATNESGAWTSCDIVDGKAPGDFSP